MPIQEDPIPGDSTNNKYFIPAPQIFSIHNHAKAIAAINEFINSGKGAWSLDSIVNSCRLLPDVKDYLETPTTKEVRNTYQWQINNAISSAIKAYINGGTFKTQREEYK